MVLIVTAADIERGGEGVFEVLNHQQLAGHTSSSGPHLKVGLSSRILVNTADNNHSIPIFVSLRRIFLLLPVQVRSSLQQASSFQVNMTLA